MSKFSFPHIRLVVSHQENGLFHDMRVYVKSSLGRKGGGYVGDGCKSDFSSQEPNGGVVLTGWVPDEVVSLGFQRLRPIPKIDRDRGL